MKIFGFTFWESSQSSLTPLQQDFLNKSTLGTWELDSKTKKITVKGDFKCDNQNLDSFLGLKFDFVTGNFSCANNHLTSLKGSPTKVGGNFDCSRNPLSTFAGAPIEIGGTFWSDFLGLKSVEWTPEGIEEAKTRGKKAHQMIQSFVNWKVGM